MKILVIVLTALLAFSCTSNKKINVRATQVVLVRHAEKLKGNNPGLNKKGLARAKALADLSEQYAFTAIYTSKYNRTKDTAKPLAKKMNIPINSRISPVAYDKMFDDIKMNHIGETVFIVGHSNTVPGMINHIMGEKKVADLKEDEFSNLYHITINGPNRTFKKMTYEPSPHGNLIIKDQ